MHSNSQMLKTIYILKQYDQRADIKKVRKVVLVCFIYYHVPSHSHEATDENFQKLKKCVAPYIEICYIRLRATSR